MESPSKQTVLSALDAFIRQRPGLDFANYGDVSLYRSESRQITKDRHHAETLLVAVSWRDGITANDILSAAKTAYSGRLEFNWDGEKLSISYCAGQYFPTEYRKAACAVLSQALWNYWRDCYETADGVRRKAARTFHRGIANRWFN